MGHVKSVTFITQHDKMITIIMDRRVKHLNTFLKTGYRPA